MKKKILKKYIYHWKKDIYNYFGEVTRVNSIQISCNDETIYYSSTKSNYIYSAYTKDILKAIENFEILIITII